MAVKVLDYPALVHKVNLIRDRNAPPQILRALLEEVTLMAMSYITEDFPKKEQIIETPMGTGTFTLIQEDSVVFVCILRAGLPMLQGALRALPKARVGFLAMKRDEESLLPNLYYKRFPELASKWVLFLDPMLATGGTLIMAIEQIKAMKPERILSLNLVASPQGLEKVMSSHPDVDFFVIRLDEGLNSKGYIVPGVGDIGDRLFTEYP
ncbi:MAG: uracil phosphoribosyltransferase [Aquificaceae bacterium]|nr:uracil phosphoribosyltransferase [Aquificaceae bacterium]